MLAFVWSAVWCARYATNRYISIPSTALVLLMIVGVVVDRRYRPFPDEHFAQYAGYVEGAPPGTHITIPIVPDGWQMELIKRGNSR